MRLRLLPATKMRSIVKRLAVLSALGATLGIVAPVAGASAAGTPVAPAELADSPSPGFPGTGFTFGADFVPYLPDDAAASGQLVTGPAVVGTIIISAAPVWAVNANNQNTMGVNVAGVQVAGL
jgi:hypothetical protein